VTRTFVAPISFGLGDLVVSLPAVQALVAEGETWLVARSSVQLALAERIEGLAGAVREEELDSRGARYVNLRDHPIQRDHWWGTEEFARAYGEIRINEILARICADRAIAADFSRPRALLARPRSGLRGAVLLVPGTDAPAKRWPAERWVALADALRAAGRTVRVMTGGGGSDGENALRESGVLAAEAPTPGEVVDVVTGCAAVVGVDTGLVHLAAQQGTPAVALFRQPAIYFRPWPHCRAVLGAPCDRACLQAERARAYHGSIDRPAESFRPAACAAGGQCLAAISPRDVLAACNEVA